MVDPQQHDDVVVYNDDSLRTLLRAIVLARGRFSLILVRCNYAVLREQIQQRLREECPVEIQELSLHGSAKTLYTFIKTFIETDLSGKQPEVLMVLGLNTVEDLDHVLTATNQVRDDFRKSFAFPLVLWVNDNVLYKLSKLAPDFNSWAGVPIRFAIATEDLIQLLQQHTNVLFAKAMNTAAGRFPRSSALYLETDIYSQRELRVAIEELQQRQRGIDPVLRAGLDFILGLDAHANEQLDEAREYYEQSLRFWQQQMGTDLTTTASVRDRKIRDKQLNAPIPNVSIRDAEADPFSTDVSQSLYIERRSCVQFYLGLWWRRYAALHRAQFESACHQAQDYYCYSIEGLLQYGHEKLAAKFIIALGEVLQRLGEWNDLEIIAKTAVRLHNTYADPTRLAYSYGLLAEVALSRSQWAEAKDYAEQALYTNQSLAHSSGNGQDPCQELSWAPPHYRSLYLLLLAEAQRHLEMLEAAEENLEAARFICHHAYDPLLYTRILEALRSLYYKQRRYLKAFSTKQEQRSIEQQYGLRAFIGAGRLQPERQVINPALVAHDLLEQPDPDANQTPVFSSQSIAVAQEIEASGRQQDVERLIARLGRTDYKLTVIHGQSGVGKSSIINAGLIPSLVQRSIDAREPLPVVLNVYTDWARELGNRLAEALKGKAQLPEAKTDFDTQFLLDQLKLNADHRSLLTVLIFDQFEEFFFFYPEPVERRPFFTFFGECLKLPYVKVVLSLREDYLHYLLECDRLNLDSLTDDILGREKRYPLGNFSPADSRLIIEQLTRRSQFSLESALIDRLVNDLSAELGEVRPIELQVVGAQLQEDDITTLREYEALGEHPKEILVEQFLEQVVQDCGSPNEEVASLVLYFLTDEKGTRPLKTLEELTADLSAQETKQIVLVLDILVKSGLVLLLPEVPSARYQLVHDYLVALIRRKQQPRLEELLSRLEQTEKERDRLSEVIAELEAEKEQRKRTEEELDQAEQTIQAAKVQRQQAEQTLREAQQNFQQSRKRQRILGIGLLGVAAVATLSAGFIFREKSRVQAEGAGVELNSQGLIASRQADSDPFPALLTAMKAGQELQQRIQSKTVRFNDSSAYNPISPRQVLQQILDEILIKNLFSGESNDREFYSVSFSPDGERFTIATAGGAVRLWDQHGKKLKDLEGHTSAVRDVSLNEDGKIVTASDDGTFRLWNSKGKLLNTFENGAGAVFGVDFSPNGEILVTATANGIIRLWDLQGNKLEEFQSHQKAVRDVHFSPNGEQLATASEDGTIRLWNLQGEKLDEIGNDGAIVWSISFSPGGRTLAIASDKGIVRIWNLRERQFVTDLKGHTAAVLDVRFSSDGNNLVTASADRTARLWNLRGESLEEFKGHREAVLSVDFGKNNGSLVTASADGTARLWDLQPKQNLRPLNCQEPGESQPKSNSLRVSAFSPNGHHVAIASVDGSICIWSLKDTSGNLQVDLQKVFNIRSQMQEQSTQILDINFTDGQHLVTTLTDGSARLWDLQGNPSGELRTGTKQNLWSVDFNLQYKILAIASDDGVIRLWNLQGKLIKEIKAHDAPILRVQFSPDGDSLVTASANGYVRHWNLQYPSLSYTLFKEYQLKGDSSQILGISFSPDEQYLVAASANGNVGLWHLQSESDSKPSVQFPAHESQVYDIAFDSKGESFATASDDRNNVRVWDLQGNLVAEFKKQSKLVRSVKFSPTNSLLVSTSEDGTASLWKIEDLAGLLVRGCKWLDDYFVTHPNEKIKETICPSKSEIQHNMGN